MRHIVIVEEGDGYVAKCLDIGTVSQGITVEAALANLKEATSLYMKEFPETDVKKQIALLKDELESLQSTIEILSDPKAEAVMRRIG